jgi:hypothetical protein
MLMIVYSEEDLIPESGRTEKLGEAMRNSSASMFKPITKWAIP